MSQVELQSISKKFGAVEVLKGIDLDIGSGEFVVLLGPSGCGKSTLLRIIAGLEDESSGDILVAGQSILDRPPAKRGIAMVFQTYALYPHLTVRANMALVLKQARYKKAEIAERVAKTARALELEPLLERKPAELSGGQRQRVAIGRAIVRDPQLFLFDEPLSNLDAALRGQVRLEIARLHQRLAATMIYVTHDQVEAMTLADRIVVLDKGIIQQIGTPRDLYERPQNRFVAGFIGSPPMNFLPLTQIAEGQGKLANGQTLPLGDVGQHGAAILGVRPHQLHLSAKNPDAAHLAGQGLKGEILLEEYLGEVSYVHLRAETGHDLIARIDPRHRHAPGETVYISFDPQSVHLFDAGTGARITGHEPGAMQ